ncbi:MAG TPA: hypothetical protein VJ821_03260 [Anaerolineales bacterium]|nr:hypothetical protein [Anaerolineales bacterium]
MKTRVYAFWIVVTLLLSACGSSVPTLLPEGLSTPIATESPATETSEALLIWESTGSPCETVAIGPGSLSYGTCGDTLATVSEQITDHASRFSELSNLFASFTAQTPAGNLIFKGSGNLVPSDSEKRATAEWAKLMYRTAQAGQADASRGRAFTWQRNGGPGDFCDNVIVYVTGLVTASDCKGYEVQGKLTASQLNQLYAWVDGLATIDHTETFPAETGGLEISLALTGNGQNQADEETIQEIFGFAATLFTELGHAAEAGAEVDEARQVLENYLTALNSGDYNLAAQLYSGDTSLLQTWNPDIGDDLPALFARGCTQNGLQCLLPRTITYRAPDNDGGYHFYVEFNNEDNTMFQQGPCCGETTGTPVSMFIFYVEKSANGLQVADLPPYVP